MSGITEQEWAEAFRFQRFPFDRPEAGNEEFARPEFLAACFVEPPNFSRILGQADAPVTALLFAARGTGKTACRVMVDYYCRTGQLPVLSAKPSGKANYVLSVPHIHLYQLPGLAQRAASAGQKPKITAELHTQEILRRAVPALADLIATVPELKNTVAALSSTTKQDLSWLVVNYGEYLTLDQAAFLHRLGLASTEQVQTETTGDLPWAQLLFRKRAQLSPLEHLAQWTPLLRELGVHSMVALVDGVDEFLESAGAVAGAYGVIRPLLTSLKLMDGTPYFALKFFLPDQVKPLLDNDRAFRKDRGFPRETIQWRDEDMITILRRRLNALQQEDEGRRSRLQVGFDELCASELRGQIETNLVQKAAGNPRQLMILCGLMVTAHCHREVVTGDEPYLLDREDWETAVQEFEVMRGGRSFTPEIHDQLIVTELIAQVEHEQLEFKSSLRWDYHQQKANTQLQIVIAKSIAGMLNRRGGRLLIGVADDGTILGLENDLKTIRGKSLDSFHLEIGQLVKGFLGGENGQFVHVRFETVQESQVCVVEIDPSPGPVYLRQNDIHEFWLRLGNATRKLDAKETFAYIQNHWSKTVL